MELADKQRIEELIKDDKKLARLYTEHQRLEGELDWFSKKRFLTHDELQRERELKVKKLQGVDKIMSIIYNGNMSTVSNS